MLRATVAFFPSEAKALNSGNQMLTWCFSKKGKTTLKSSEGPTLPPDLTHRTLQQSRSKSKGKQMPRPSCSLQRLMGHNSHAHPHHRMPRQLPVARPLLGTSHPPGGAPGWKQCRVTRSPPATGSPQTKMSMGCCWHKPFSGQDG